jgi:two-component system CheB/CheR fusion protein
MPENETKDFYIVGIGASAGGLDAIQKLFDHIPSNTGIAFVIIQHLSPDFKSLMPELLSKHTSMPIFTAEDQLEVYPNSIYLMHRNKNLVIKGNKLHLLEKAPKHSLNLPIDIFFQSLGEEYKEKSIGVILSGTGTDGSRGIKTIKESGGVILVQDPLSAQFNGMPNAAIASGLAEFIAEPEAMATVLQQIPNLDLATELSNNQSNDEIFSNILDEIKIYAGIDFKQYKKNTLVRRIEKRMSLNNIDALLNYYQLLKASVSEIELLKQDFLIGVTSFFRDRDAFDELKRTVIPALFVNKLPTDTIRVWIVACSTGEEAYSIAILLDEYIQENHLRNDFKIFATDVDFFAVQAASTGKFNVGEASEIDKKYLDAYFIKNVDSLQIIKRIRDKIVFSNHNILKDTPFIRIDLISCRNLLIYLNASSQQKVLSSFLFSLQKDGFLFLGSSESINESADEFKVINQRWRIFKNIAKSKRTPNFESPSLLTKELLSKSPKELMNRTLENAKDNTDLVYLKFLTKKYSPSCIFFDKSFNILYIKGDAGKYLKFPEGMFQSNLLKMLGEGLGVLLQTMVNEIQDSDKAILIKDNLVFKDQSPLSFNLYLQKVNEADGFNDTYLIHFEDTVIEIEKEIEFSKVQVSELNELKIKELEKSLIQNKNQLQYVVEELETSNEELQASNEELMASNEELQSTNEELQSVNEELYTVNFELQDKNRELNLLYNDINNLFDSTDVGTLFLDSELKIRKFTPSLQKHFELNEKDIGRSISNFAANFKEEVRLKMIKDAALALVEIGTIEDEFKDDFGHYYIRRISPFITIDKKVDGVVITFVDVTKLKNLYDTLEAKEKLIEKESLYNKSIIENNSFYVIKTDLEGNYTYFNQYFSDMFGVQFEDLIGKSSFSLIIPEDHAACINTVEKCLAEPNKTFWTTLRKPSPAGVIVSQWEFKVLKDDQGNPNEILCLGHEITPLIKKQEELQSLLNINLNQKNRLIQFTHILSHNFRSHVANLKGIMSLANSATNEEKLAFCDMVSSVANSLDETLINLNDIIAIQTTEGIPIKPILLSSAVQLAEKSLGLTIAETNATIHQDFDENDLIQANPAYLDSILLNLLTNSLKYKKPDTPPEIHITLERIKGFSKLVIRDNGRGLDLKKYGSKVFGLYKTFHGNRDAKGLGLFITKTQVESMHGNIDIVSEPNMGATVIVELPYSD